MKNSDVFNQYDMVVSMTQKTINDQLTHLLKMGIIQSQLIIVQEFSGRNYDYKVLDSSDQMPLDNQGNPLYACIDAVIQPRIDIKASGTALVFILHFRSGTACFWEGFGPRAYLQSYDMAGWEYGVGISLDLKAIEKNDIGSKLKVPDLVENQLNHFMTDMFKVNSLFLDFESTDLLNFDPAYSSAREAGDTSLQQLVEFMSFYLADLVKKGNPYILGYSLNTTDQTQMPPDQNVPDQLRPVGTTFTLYRDPNDQELSNLNFVLATRGGHGSIAGTPGTFDSNWISPTEQCDAKMIYSHTCLLEHFILIPLFDQMREGVYAQIKDQISVPIGNDYASAKKPFTNRPDFTVSKGSGGLLGGLPHLVSHNTNGFDYIISNITNGNDQYVNTYSVVIENTDTRLDLKFAGYLHVYKHVDRDMGFCTATASAEGTIYWAGNVTIAAEKDAKGEPTLTLNKNFTIANSDKKSDRNTCAEAFDWIGKILGGILDSFTYFLDQGAFTRLLDGVFDLHTPGIGNLGAVFGNLSNVLQNVIILPAGQVFFFRNPASDPEANLSLELTYKSEN